MILGIMFVDKRKHRNIPLCCKKCDDPLKIVDDKGWDCRKMELCEKFRRERDDSY